MTDGSTIAEIERLEDARYDAMVTNDLATLDALLNDGLIYLHSSGVEDSKTSYLAGLESGRNIYRGIVRSNRRIDVFGDAATVICNLEIDYLNAGQAKLITSRALAVWSRADGPWRLVVVQSAALPTP